MPPGPGVIVGMGHNRFYLTTDERDAALTAAFHRFQREPSLIDAHVAVWRR
jgi:hypothetical protein